MICPVCTNPENRIIRKEDAPKGDRRTHECDCGVRWVEIGRLEPGSVRVHKQSTEGAISSRQGVLLVADNPQDSGAISSASRISDPDLISESDPDLSANTIRARARSTHGAEFVRLLRVFSERWTRSYKRPYPVSSADRAQLGRFMREHPNYIDTFAAICDRYLSDRQQFLIQRTNGHTLRWLVTTGLALYGGTPRESAEQAAARFRKEHEARKRQGPSRSPELRSLVAQLADAKSAADG